MSALRFLQIPWRAGVGRGSWPHVVLISCSADLVHEPSGLGSMDWLHSILAPLHVHSEGLYPLGFPKYSISINLSMQQASVKISE
jgi:hypothetical protein